MIIPRAVLLTNLYRSLPFITVPFEAKGAIRLLPKISAQGFHQNLQWDKRQLALFRNQGKRRIILHQMS